MAKDEENNGNGPKEDQDRERIDEERDFGGIHSIGENGDSNGDTDTDDSE